MRYILGGLALIAAVVIVGCSATTLFLTAFNSVSVPWQQWVAGVTIATVVAWEAVALLVISFCFRKWHWVLGLGTSIALVLAMAVTASMEWKLYLGGRADVSVERSVKADDRDRVRAELDRAYTRRDKLQEMERLTTFQKQELTEVKSRISKLENQWDTRTVMVKASGNVEGEAIQDLLGWDARTTQIIIDTLPMWLMMLLRVISVPGAVIAFQAMRSEKPQEARTAAKASDPISVAPAPVTAVQDPPATPQATAPEPVDEKWATDAEVKKLHALVAEMKSHGLVPDPDGAGTPIAQPEPKIEEVAEDPKIVRPAVWHEESAPPVAPRTNGKRQRNHLNRKDQTVIQWLGDCCSITDDSTHIATGRQCFASYKHYCDARRISEKDRVPQNRMSTLLSGQLGTRIDGRGKRNGNGAVFPGLMINPIAAQARRRVA